MPVSDALVVGEGWISEHYFTTDAVKESFQKHVVDRRKTWDSDKEKPSTRSRFTTARAELLSTFATLEPDDDRLPGLYDTIKKVLGYDRVGLKRDHHGPVVHVHAAGLTGAAPLAIVHGRPVESVEDLLKKDADTLLDAWQSEDGDTETSVARTVSRLFTAAEHPDFVLVLAGGLALVAEREKWAEGRYLLVDLQLVCERNEDKKHGEVDRALVCLDADSLAPDADGKTWWNTPLEESVRHTVGVSSDLRDGVRLSIEIIANEVVARRGQKGLEPLAEDQAQPLARQSLRFLYRILFLLYAEASPELGVLPTGATEYERGYSLDRLRDLTLTKLATPNAQRGTHLYESLGALFRLVDEGHDPQRVVEHETGDDGLRFRSLKADLFLPTATELIDEVGLGNEALQRVLDKLLLTKETKKGDRGFISYAELGINQLGAVYEGLMSYTGFFATEDLHEVAKNGDASKGSWVVPTHRSDGIAAADFVMTTNDVTGETRPVVHERGSFVYRLAGRERQQSASYYTPEVLTKFVVSQALEELLDQDGATTTAREILDLTVCEPALGSGAFAIEAVRQLAAEYLTRRQAETGETIDPDEYPRELQKVKAYLALHQVHGVDLNATAVELAEISLWLDTMVEGLSAPWFGLRLKRGNSLVGARRSVYRPDQLKGRAWLKTVPTDRPLHGGESTDGSIHHFLLPAEGWGAAVDAKEAKELAPEALAALKEWRKSVLKTPSKKQEKDLVDIARRVEVLWSIAARRLEVAEQQIRRSIHVWGAEDLPVGGAVTREQIEASLADADGAYRRLRLVMDAWCALWFWPLTDSLTTVESEVVAPPSLEDWVKALQDIVGKTGALPKGDQLSFADAQTWEDLGNAEHDDLAFAQARRAADVHRDHPWLTVVQRIADQHGFFHWELDFSFVFSRGGFDLQVGNPPWVRPDVDVESSFAEFDVWWALAHKPSEADKSRRREALLGRSGAVGSYILSHTVNATCTKTILGSHALYPVNAGSRVDLYRTFIASSWRTASARGVTGLVHPESMYTDQTATLTRASAYRRLRRLWCFKNSLGYFEMATDNTFAVAVYAPELRDVGFYMATSIHTPDTIERSFRHDGNGPPPGVKDEDGRWDHSPHASRLVFVDDDALSAWDAVHGGSRSASPAMVMAGNAEQLRVVKTLAAAERVRSYAPEFSSGWNERTDREKGRFVLRWDRPASWESVILQGPHIFVANPFFKAPNRTLKNKQDWHPNDLETLPSQLVPATGYQPSGDPGVYRTAIRRWGSDDSIRSTSVYRLAWRNMMRVDRERSYMPTVIPPGPTHVHGITSMGLVGSSSERLVDVAAVHTSLLIDFFVRVVPRSTIAGTVVERLPIVSDSNPLLPLIRHRYLRLVCLTDAWSELWRDSFGDEFTSDRWAYGSAVTTPLGDIDRVWNDRVPLRAARTRYQAEIEIDALVALALGVDIDDLCFVYRSHFSVLRKYDAEAYFYDANGRLVPNSVLTMWRQKGERISEEERTATHPAGATYTYELPFATLDREANMRQAYAHFEDWLRDKS